MFNAAGPRSLQQGELTMFDGGYANALTPTRAAILKGLAIAAAGLIAGAIVMLAPKGATALPAYSQKEGKACGYCHMNPAGGGPRNAKGKQYEVNGHKFK
jgi:hypothetical protein